VPIRELVEWHAAVALSGGHKEGQSNESSMQIEPAGRSFRQQIYALIPMRGLTPDPAERAQKEGFDYQHLRAGR